ncbi:hypothetical protein [Streptomyces sediminimaris]|uniref:hypothetical protein n=1 Tax=Streptomyces sediminimaris TaxID=3383721 RepID=UPI00399A40BA
MLDPARLITPEIADAYSVSLHTVTKTWSQHPHWPAPTGKRGRYKEYAAQDIAAFVRDHIERPTVELEARRLYTAPELEAAGIGITAGTIRADLTRGRWPQPDATDGGTNHWYGATATKALEGRRSYHKTQTG